ncbi:MAG TPA: hypothetical protein VM266_16675 [Solirubrobacteraceae bacterium]|nr:hypothetical protein [Solirubrobacteraceae bacterium]
MEHEPKSPIADEQSDEKPAPFEKPDDETRPVEDKAREDADD